MTSAFGKVILLGEHAVVHGHPAVAAALDRGVTAEAKQSGSGPARLVLPEWQLDIGQNDEGPVAAALAALITALDADGQGIRIDAHTELPAGAGLGSSAAMSVAITKAIAEVIGRTLTAAEIERTADAAERCFHETPSGVDVALATRGGIGLFRRGHGLEPIVCDPLPLAIGLSGEPRRTADMVARVSAALESDEAGTGALLSELGSAASCGKRALESGNFEALGKAMNDAQVGLASLGLSTTIIDTMIETARHQGALGAKLTGAGGGGAVIALAPGREQAIARAWIQAGHEAFVATAGVTT